MVYIAVNNHHFVDMLMIKHVLRRDSKIIEKTKAAAKVFMRMVITTTEMNGDTML